MKIRRRRDERRGTSKEKLKDFTEEYDDVCILSSDCKCRVRLGTGRVKGKDGVKR